MTRPQTTATAREPLVPKLLVDLVMDPRDPGYEAAARRRGGQPSTSRYDRPAVVVGCLAIGFTLAVSYAHTNRGAPEAAKVHAALVSRVRTAEKQGDQLTATAQSLSNQLNALRDSALSGSSTLVRGLTTALVEAGQVAVTGPGLTVVLKEPPAPASTAPNGSRANDINVGNVLTDRDVRSVVNELWSDGAEAIAVNGIRLTPTSAIRFAGDAVLVDFQPISSPYMIQAIGNANTLDATFAQSDTASRYQTLESAKGVGFTFTEQSAMRLPASPPTTLRYARIPTPSTPAPTASGAHK